MKTERNLIEKKYVFVFYRPYNPSFLYEGAEWDNGHPMNPLDPATGLELPLLLRLRAG